MPGVVGVWPGAVALPVPTPVVPGVVLDAPGAVTPGEAAPVAAPAEVPPAAPPAAPPPAPPAPPPAANAQPEDMARAIVNTNVAVFMISVSWFVSKDKDCHDPTFLH
jgi:hypothetical protein